MCLMLAKPGVPTLIYRYDPRYQGARTMFDVLYVLFASIGVILILGALTYVTLLIGGLVNGMVVLLAGPVIDRIIEKRKARAKA